MIKNLTLLNTALLVILFISFFVPPVKHAVFGNASVLTTATQFNDIQLDSTNGIGTATLYVNNRIAIASSSVGITYYAGTINATTSLVDAGTLSVTGVSTIGVLNSTGTLDTLGASSCGGQSVASATIKGANGVGRVTTGGDASSTCKITFGTAFVNTPSCEITTETSAQSLSTSTVITPAAGTLTISQSSSGAQFSAVVFDYHCIGN